MQCKSFAGRGVRGAPVASRNVRKMAAPMSRGAMSIRCEKVGPSTPPNRHSLQQHHRQQHKCTHACMGSFSLLQAVDLLRNAYAGGGH